MSFNGIDELLEVLDDGTVLIVDRPGKLVRLTLKGEVAGFVPGDIVRYKGIFPWSGGEYLLVGLAGKDGERDSKPAMMWTLERDGFGVGYLKPESLAGGQKVKIAKKAETPLTSENIKDKIKEFLGLGA